jgi:hypothetical protein
MVIIIIIIIIIILQLGWHPVAAYIIHLHSNSTQNTEDETHIRNTNYNWEVNWEVRAVPLLCELYPGICLTTEEQARENLS